MKKLIITIGIIIFVSCAKDKLKFINSDDINIEYMGRISYNQSKGAQEFYWSGTSVEINFSGSEIFAVFEDERGDNYFNVIIDEDSLYILKLEPFKKKYKLCELSEGNHTVKIFKRTEWANGRTLFYGFEFGEGTSLLTKSISRVRKIEFYGNSITSGHGNEDTSGLDRADSIFTNNYLTYASITARHFNAQYSCISRGGIGIMVSWFPIIMPDIYDRINPLDEKSKWDFEKYQPDIVVINLLQNDSWLINMPEHPSFKLKFGDSKPDEKFIISAYKDFVINIRDKYPDANILCILGSMDIMKEGSFWPGYVIEAVKQLNDEKLFTHFIPFKNTDGHPSVSEHKIMAESLIKFIDNNISW